MNQLGRPALAATVRAAARDVTAVNCHLKSKLLSYPSGPSGATRFNPRDEGERARYGAYALYRRTAEAATLRSYLTDRLETADPDEVFVLAGDCNDEPAAATTQILQAHRAPRSALTGSKRPDHGDHQRLWNLAPLLPPDQAHGRVYRGRGELIDHVFVSRRLLDVTPTVRTSYPAGAVMPPISEDPDEIRNLPGSDHAAVTATFTIN